MLGVENLKKALKFVFDFTTQVAQTKKFNFWAIFGFIDDLVALGDIITKWKDIQAEFKDLDEAEKQEIYEYAKAEFDLPNDQVEAFIEDALQWALVTFALVERAKLLKK